MVCDRERVGLGTTHLPIKEVAAAVTVEKIVEKSTTLPHESASRLPYL